MNEEHDWKPLYLLTDGGSRRRAGTLVSGVARALEAAHGQIGMVQLREQVPRSEHPASDSELLFLAEKLRRLCDEHSAKLILSRRSDLFDPAIFHGIHLGKDAESISLVRRVIGEAGLLGYSAHSVSEALTAFSAGCDYVLISPIFKPRSKWVPARHIQGIAILQKLRAKTDRPVYALGGMTPEKLASCMKAGATGIASLSALDVEADPASMLQNFVAAYQKFRNPRKRGFFSRTS